MTSQLNKIQIKNIIVKKVYQKSHNFHNWPKKKDQE